LIENKVVLSRVSMTKRDEKAEVKSIMSNSASPVSENRNTKFTVGSKLGNGAIVKEVKNEDWIFINERDKYSHKLYQCRNCNSSKKIRS